MTILKCVRAIELVTFEWMTNLPIATDVSYVHEILETPVLAWLIRRDFARASLKMPGFALWSSYREFTDERDSLYLGYGYAGVAARRQRVSFEAFERWVRLTGAPGDIDGLDEFAAHCRWRADHPHALVVGRFWAPGDPERSIAGAGGIQSLPILPEVYLRWRDDYARGAPFPPPNVDGYAAHVAECCLPSGRCSRWPAVSSS